MFIVWTQSTLHCQKRREGILMVSWSFSQHPFVVAISPSTRTNVTVTSLYISLLYNYTGDEDSFFGACEDWWGDNNRENVIDQLRSISGYSCPYEDSNCFDPNPNKAGYYAIPGKAHDFIDSSPNSEFMNPSTPWGLPLTFDWLAEQGRTSSPTTAAPTNDPTSSPTKQPSKAPTTSDPTSSPTAAAAPGICSSNSGDTAGTPCHESSECQCGGRRMLQAEANQQRDLAKGGNGGNKPNPPSPTPPVTPSPTSAPSSEVCGCIFPSTPAPAPAPAPTPESCSSFTSKNTCNEATGGCFWCDDSEQPTNGKGQCCSGIFEWIYLKSAVALSCAGDNNSSSMFRLCAPHRMTPAFFSPCSSEAPTVGDTCWEYRYDSWLDNI